MLFRETTEKQLEWLLCRQNYFSLFSAIVFWCKGKTSKLVAMLPWLLHTVLLSLTTVLKLNHFDCVHHDFQCTTSTNRYHQNNLKVTCDGSKRFHSPKPSSVLKSHNLLSVSVRLTMFYWHFAAGKCIDWCTWLHLTLSLCCALHLTLPCADVKKWSEESLF